MSVGRQSAELKRGRAADNNVRRRRIWPERRSLVPPEPAGQTGAKFGQVEESNPALPPSIVVNGGKNSQFAP